MTRVMTGLGRLIARPNFKGTNGKLAEIAAGFLALHTCRPDCPCSALQHLHVVASARQAHRDSSRKWNKAKLQVWRAKNPDYFPKWNRNHREGINRRYRERYAATPEKFREIIRKKHRKRAARLLEGDRLKNLEGLDIKTGLRVSLAAHEVLAGMKPYAMRLRIYPDSKDPFNAIKKLFDNHDTRIDAEKKRIMVLSKQQRAIEENNLRNRLAREITGK